jgi:hypothetical protein
LLAECCFTDLVNMKGNIIDVRARILLRTVPSLGFMLTTLGTTVGGC